MDTIVSFVEEVRTVLLAISTTFAVIGFLGLGMMYVGSSLPLISDWKQNNPKAFSNVTMGLIILMFAAGGGVAMLLNV
jgi:hypothetical protein